MEINIPPPPDGSAIVTSSKPSKNTIPPPPDGSGIGSVEPKVPTEKQIDKTANVWNQNPNVKNLDKADVLKEQMAKDLISNPNPAYKENYIKTLSKQGYDEKALNKYAKSLNIPIPELTEQEVKDKYGKGVGVIDPLEPITNWAMDFVGKTGTALGQAGEKFKEGIGTLLEATSDVRSSESKPRGETLVKGGLQTATGTASTMFNLIPAAVTFNAGVDAINTTAQKNLSEENAKTVENATSIPFTLFSRLTGAMGIKPEEGSNQAMASELFDLILAGKVIHSAVKGKDALSNRIKSVADLKEISKEVAENKLNEEQLKEYKDYVESLKNITADDIKKMAIEKNTPESLALAKKIEELSSPTIGETAEGLPRVVAPTAENLAEANKLKEESLTQVVFNEDGIPRVIKPTQEEINIAFKEKANEQSKNVFDAIKSGEADINKLKSSLDFAQKQGKLTPEEHALAIQKIDTYNNYYEKTKDVHISDEAKRNVFDLTWTNENLKAQIELLDKNPESQNKGTIEHSKKNALETIYNENQRQIDNNLVEGIADQMGAVSEKTQEKVLKNKVTSDNEFSPEEKVWAKNPSNVRAVKAVIGEGKTHEAFKQEAKKQFWKEQPENIAKVDKMFEEGKEISEKVWEAEMERQWKESQSKGSTIPEIKSNPPTEEHKVLHEYIDTKLPGKNFNNLADVNNSAKADLIVEHMLENDIRILKGGIIEVGDWAKKVGVKGNLLPHYYDVDFGGKKVKFASSEHTAGMKSRNLQGRKVDVQLVLPEDANLDQLVKDKIIDKHELVEVDGKPAGFKFEGSKEVYPHILVAREVMPDRTTGPKIANLVSSDFSEFIKKKAGREGARSKKPVAKENIVNPPKETIVDENKVDVDEQGLEKDIVGESEGSKVPTPLERDEGFTVTEESKIENELLTEHKLYEDEAENREAIEELPERDSSEQEPIIESIESKTESNEKAVLNEVVKEADEFIEKVKKKISGQLNFQFAKAMKHEVTTPYDQVLQYFIGGGKIKAEAMKELFSDSAKSEGKLREGYIDKTPLKNEKAVAIDDLAHDMWTKQKVEGQYDTSDFRNAIEEAVMDFNTRSEMAKHLNESFTEKDTRNIDTSVKDDASPAASVEGKSVEELTNEQEMRELRGEAGTAEYKAKAEELIKKIRESGKFFDDKATSAVPFLKEAWKGAHELVALSIEGGMKLTEAIAKGVEYFKNTDFYKKLSKEEQVKNLADLKASIVKDIDPYKLSQELKGAKFANTKYNVSNKIADAKGFTRDLFELVSTTLNNINPALKGALRNYQLDLKTSMDKDLVPAKDFLAKVKSMNKMSKADFSDFDFARKNGDVKKINELVRKYGMEAEYKKMNEAIESLDKRAEELDLPTNFKVGDAPVRVKDYKGLMKYVEKELGTDAKSIKDEAEIREAYLERPMTEEEMGEFASEILRKRATKNIPYITPEMEKFYDSADDALINYITSMNLKIATREFAGLGDAQKGFETSTGTMWKKANELLSKGEITPDQYKQVTEVITAYFNKGEANKAMTMLKNIGFIDVMGNVSSALGQIGDIGFAMYKFGPLTTAKEFVKSIGGKSEIKASDVVADDILSEYGHSGLSSQKVVKSVFKWAGLEKMEKLSNETIVNSHIAKMRKDAMRLDKMGRYDKKAFMDKIEGVFEPTEVKQVIKDLISGKKTDNVIRLAYNGILDLKPIGKSEVPLKYLENPNGRVMYSLKLYTLKSIDILRNEIGKDLASKDKVRVARGTKNLILLSSSLALMGGTMDELRDLIGNKKKMSLSDRVFYSYLKTIGINSYMVGSAKREGLAPVLAKQITPSIITQPIKILQDIYDDVNGAHKGKTLTHLPIFGKILYDNLNDKK